MWQVVLFNVTNGLIIGAFYVLMALGLSLILNLSNVINFAHGNFLALGAYLAFQLIIGVSIPAFTFPGVALIPSFSFPGLTLLPGLPYWAALLIAPLLTALIGVAVERSMIRRIYNR